MSLTKKDLKLAGEIMAMSILQGGQAPNLITSQLSIYQMNSVPHRELFGKVSMLQNNVRFIMTLVLTNSVA